MLQPLAAPTTQHGHAYAAICMRPGPLSGARLPSNLPQRKVDAPVELGEHPLADSVGVARRYRGRAHQLLCDG
jgi:hypothetical protein